MPLKASNFTCRYAEPGFGCNIPEMIVLGFLFWIAAVSCIVFLIYHIRSKKQVKTANFDYNYMFWITMMIWLTYRGTICLFPFDYDKVSFRIVYINVNMILYLIPLSTVILLVCELLFTYRSPGTKLIIFFRILFFVFVSVFLIIGIVLSFADDESNIDVGKPISLWHFCTDFLFVVFFTVPAKKLLDAIMYPVIQPEDVSCVRFSKFGILFFSVLFGLRSLYNLLNYVDVNPIQNFMNRETDKATRILSTGARIVQFFYYFVFDFLTSVMLITSVFMFRRHDIQFADDPFYAKQPSDGSALF